MLTLNLISTVDLLWLYRTLDSLITQCTGFTFPKLPSSQSAKQCVIQVNVTWKRFKFHHELIVLQQHQVKDAIQKVVQDWSNWRHPSLTSSILRVVVCLSGDDLASFPDSQDLSIYRAIMLFRNNRGQSERGNNRGNCFISPT